MQIYTNKYNIPKKYNVATANFMFLISLHFKEKYMSVNLIVVTGPTATGKTGFAAALAYSLGSEVIVADSRQVYRTMDIGTGKDIAAYNVNGVQVPYHLVDIADAGYKYNVFEYQRDFLDIFQRLRDRGIIPVLCGGTGLYIEAVLKGYRLVEVPPDETLRSELEHLTLGQLTEMLSTMKKLHNITDVDTKKRAIRAIEIELFYEKNKCSEQAFPKIEPVIFGIRFSRNELRQRITQRLKTRLDEGMVEEAKKMLENGLTFSDLEYYGLEYKFLSRFLSGQISYQQMFEGLNTAIHQFAKRQDTWFRRMERNGMKIHWLDGHATMEEKLHEARIILSPN